MHSKNYKRNTNFQILNFLVGSCHTPDGAYSLLCDLKVERESALAHYEVSKLKNKAKRLKLEEELRTAKMEWEKLDLEAELQELENGEKTSLAMLPATLDEFNYINHLIEKVQTVRKYKHLSEVEANEATQRDEWKLELMWRAENHMLSTKHIPADEIAHMRMHPDFRSDILPHIHKLERMMMLPKDENEVRMLEEMNQEFTDRISNRKLLMSSLLEDEEEECITL